MMILEKFNKKASSYLEMVAGFALVSVTVLTGCDIIGRLLRMPILGTYEIVSFTGGLVVGLTIPAVSRAKAHLTVDLLLEKVPPKVKSVLEIFNRALGIILISLLAYSIMQIGNDFRTSGEVSSVIHVPFYPVAYGVAVALVVEVFVLIDEFFKKEGERNE